MRLGARILRLSSSGRATCSRIWRSSDREESRAGNPGVRSRSILGKGFNRADPGAFNTPGDPLAQRDRGGDLEPAYAALLPIPAVAQPCGGPDGFTGAGGRTQAAAGA